MIARGGGPASALAAGPHLQGEAFAGARAGVVEHQPALVVTRTGDAAEDRKLAAAEQDFLAGFGKVAADKPRAIGAKILDDHRPRPVAGHSRAKDADRPPGRARAP